MQRHEENIKVEEKAGIKKEYTNLHNSNNMDINNSY